MPALYRVLGRLRLLSDGISDAAPWPAEPTFANGRVLGHLFFRLPSSWRGCTAGHPSSLVEA